MRPVFAQDYFSEEFNQTRPGGQLDPEKWVVYENRPPVCSGDLIKETGGFATFIQCVDSQKFPYVTSKNDPFPQENFTAVIKFQYTNVRPWGTGIQIADTAPNNGGGFTSLFSLGVWEDRSSGLGMRINFKDSVVYHSSINTLPHELKIERKGSVYKLYLDNQLIFTTPVTQEKVHAIYLGNPSTQSGPPYPGWTWFKVDYIRVTDDGPAEIIPEPFLDLPWDYESKGISFNDSALSITSYFDHEYPLLSAGLDLSETSTSNLDLVNFFGDKNPKLPYSKHDGYDYAKRARVNFKDPVKAAAAGKAYFKTFFPGPFSRCGACGEMIVIDHGNGFMTRYLHLDDSSFLIANRQNTGPISVTTGQLIGYVGHTGNTDPADERGAHIHFDVIQDKNNDGNFEDNIPDGITDPFGWQSAEPDPWENYSFFYNGAQRKGAKSYYLFTKKLDHLKETLSSNAKVFEVGKAKLEIPEGTTNQDLDLSIKSEPNFTSNLLNSLGSILNIEAKNSAGNQVTTFLKNFSLSINFSQFDLSHYNLDTLSIYSSTDGENWTKENTSIDSNNKNATTFINHLTHFALMAERLDTTAPVTTPTLEGQKGTGNNFRSDVKLYLDSTDNGGLGVEFTAYGFEESQWQTYTSPLTFSTEGYHKIYFYSQDKDGNLEEIKSLEFSIDKTIPEAEIFADPQDYQIKVIAEPEGSGEVTLNKDRDKATYNITDQAGNNLEISTELKENGIPKEIKILSLKYNSDPPIQLPKNTYTTDFILKPSPKSSPELIRINHFFDMDGYGKYIIFADARKNITKIDYFNGKIHTSEEKPGIVLLKLLTNKGKFEYSF